ncbi:MAG: hybrid sensor histidine kinase/response regulator [Ignavibacteria bacterium]|nr:MAG: hybrid sensor histidine kinase/response regulator [Ignavibacteria bacterium]
MSDDVLSKFAAEEFLAHQNAAVAIANNDLKIAWYNQSFKKYFGAGRIKGISITNLFSISETKILSNTKSKKLFVHPLTDSNSNVIITPVFKKTKKTSLIGYSIELVQLRQSETGLNIDLKLVERNIAFSNELEKLFVILVKENSLEHISEQLISKSVEISKSNFGLIVYQDDSEKYEFQFHNTNKFIKDEKEAEKAILPDFSFINKWLLLNKKSLLALNHQNNIGFNLTEILNCESLIISPCFFEDQLLATIMVGKNKGTYSAFEINIVEQLSTLLSFAISNIRTRELNTALESRLLQAQKLETIGKLSSGMAHDFSNLLSSIFGSLNLLRKKVPDTDDTKRLIDNIESCSVRARDLTKGLLSYGKSTPKRKELVKPNLLVDEISKVVTQTFPGTIKYIEHVDENLHNILGNSTEVYQVLLNLCVNAKEATDGEGTITLSANNISIDKKNIINYPLLNEGNYVLFTVKDDGSGIEEKDLQKIFDPYFSTKDKETVSGLGLYVSYGIIKAHKGMIEVTSKVGAGTQFDVYIPAFEPQKEKKPSSPDKIILLADDEEMLSDLLAELLESNNYNVIKVSSGKEALRVLTEEIKVDLLIIDYNMPEMSGLETIEKIRKLNLDVPVILSSGVTDFDTDEIMDKYEINSCVQKPYVFETMLETIQTVI